MFYVMFKNPAFSLISLHKQKQINLLINQWTNTQEYVINSSLSKVDSTFLRKQPDYLLINQTKNNKANRFSIDLDVSITQLAGGLRQTLL